MEGTVKWFDPERGFGFIRPDDGGDDCFVHHSRLLMAGYRSLEAGQRVEFEPRETPKGIAAFSVKLLAQEAPP